MYFFQLPGLPELLLGGRRFAALRRLLENDSPSAFDADDIERYVTAARQAGSLRGGLNYYRAAMRRSPLQLQRDARVITRPVLVIWGAKDRHLGIKLATPDAHWVPNARVEIFPHATHWVHMEEPDRVTGLIADFSSAPEGQELAPA